MQHQTCLLSKIGKGMYIRGLFILVQVYLLVKTTIPYFVLLFLSWKDRFFFSRIIFQLCTKYRPTAFRPQHRCHTIASRQKYLSSGLCQSDSSQYNKLALFVHCTNTSLKNKRSRFALGVAHMHQHIHAYTHAHTHTKRQCWQHRRAQEITRASLFVRLLLYVAVQCPRCWLGRRHNNFWKRRGRLR